MKRGATQGAAARRGRGAFGTDRPHIAIAARALAPAATLAQTAAPVIGAGQSSAIADQYIVVMKSAASDASKERTKIKARAKGGRVNRDFKHALNGYAASLPAGAVAEVRSDPAVAYVEADAIVAATTTQSSAPWGLDRSIRPACR